MAPIKSPVFLVFLFSTFLCFGCRSDTPESKFEKYLQTENVNNTIQLSIPPYLDQVQDSPEEIYLELSNHSDDLIRFPTDYGIHLYLYNDQTKDWVEIENKTIYSYGMKNIDEESSIKQIEQEGGIPLYPEGSPFGKPSSTQIYADPALAGGQLPDKIRVLVVGTIFREDKATDEKVAAYYDFVIKP